MTDTTADQSSDSKQWPAMADIDKVGTMWPRDDEGYWQDVIGSRKPKHGTVISCPDVLGGVNCIILLVHIGTDLCIGYGPQAS